MLILQNAPLKDAQLPGLKLSSVAGESTTTKFDLSLNVEEAGGGLQAWIEYDTDLFDAQTIGRMAGHFVRLLEEVVAKAEGYYGSANELLPLIDADSRAALWVLAMIYYDLLVRIRAKKCDVFSTRVRVPSAGKLVILARGAVMALRNRRNA